MVRAMPNRIIPWLKHQAAALTDTLATVGSRVTSVTVSLGPLTATADVSAPADGHSPEPPCDRCGR